MFKHYQFVISWINAKRIGLKYAYFVWVANLFDEALLTLNDTM